MKHKKIFSWFLYIFISGLLISVQAVGQFPPQSEKRSLIDAKRIDSDMFSEDALPRSREFIRIDSTYYVGYMYEGIFKTERAADFLGYRNAVAPLKKALELLERDYASRLKMRTGDLMNYYPAYRFQLDYTQIAYFLMDCYLNINLPEEAFQVVKQAQKWDFQREFYMQSYTYLSWIVHKNRFYTSSDYSFLSDNIAENEILANAYLDSALLKIEKDKRLNQLIYEPGYHRIEKQSVYHYKSLLHGYNMRMDSAQFYYDLLKEGPIFPRSNYGNFLNVNGKFKEALQMYQSAAQQDMGDKRLQEWAYYSSILRIYKSEPQIASEHLEELISVSGSTPGFGWYQIALSRSALYEGNLEKSKNALRKAEGFKELHIGTTLGQTHYDFSTNILNMMNYISEIEHYKFEHRNWWYHPLKLWKVITLTIKKYLNQYLIINQLAENPEREQVIYPLFATESTVSWDEIWFLLKDFSSSYFLKIYQNQLEEEERPLIRKYHQLFLAKLEIKKGNYESAYKLLLEIIEQEEIDEEYEKLFLARCFEALSICAERLGDKTLHHESLYNFYLTFPQLIPSSTVKMNFHLQINGKDDKAFLKKLKKSNISWVTDLNYPAPILHLDFVEEEGKPKVNFSVLSNDNQIIIPVQGFTYQDPEQAAKQVLFAIFEIEKS